MQSAVVGWFHALDYGRRMKPDQHRTPHRVSNALLQPSSPLSSSPLPTVPLLASVARSSWGPGLSEQDRALPVSVSVAPCLAQVGLLPHASHEEQSQVQTSAALLPVRHTPALLCCVLIPHPLPRPRAVPVPVPVPYTCKLVFVGAMALEPLA